MIPAAEVVEATQTGFEKLAWHISAWSSLLILIGIGGIYFEVKTPGFGLGAGIAALAFGIFFFGNFLAGKLAGYEVLGVFVLGLTFVIIELAVFPGIIFGVIGACLMIGSLLFAMVDKIDFGRIGTENIFTGETFSILDTFYWPLISLAFGLIGGIVLVIVLMKYLPNIPIPGIVLQREIGAGGSVKVNQIDDLSESEVHPLLGQEGIAVMDLRPVGKVEIAEKRFDVISGGEFIRKGTTVRVIAVEQMRTIVEAV